jgi:dolichol-phosphate mannosyltransferase
MNKTVALVVPVYNEAGNIRSLVHEISQVFETLPRYEYRLYFVDDGSTDGSVRAIREMEANGPTTCIQLSRNFGKEAALSAGIAEAEGEAVILLDADLQHPPSYIPAFLAEWEKGADVVIGVRKRNPDESVLRKVASKIFAMIMRTIGDAPSVAGATDFRLIDRTVADEFKKFTEHGRIARGLIDWLGFTRAYVPFDAGARNAGKAQYGFRKLVMLGFSAFVSHSLLPLRVAGFLGLFITLFAGGLGLFILIEQRLLADPLNWQIPATAQLAVMILFLNGIVLISLGLVSVYIAKIHRETVNRPLYIVRKKRT